MKGQEAILVEHHGHGFGAGLHLPDERLPTAQRRHDLELGGDVIRGKGSPAAVESQSLHRTNDGSPDLTNRAAARIRPVVGLDRRTQRHVGA